MEAGTASPTYTIVKGSTTTINFTIETNATVDPWQKWYNWMGQAIHTDGWICSRGDNLSGCEWHSTGFVFSTSYSDGFDGMFTQTNMDGASVALTITRDASNNVQIQSVSKKGSDTWTKTLTFTLSNDDNMTYVLKAEYAYGTINSVVSDKFVGPAANSTTWWNNFSDYYTVAANKTLTLNFKNYSSKNENWSNFVTVITNDYDRGASSYAEEVVLRVDDYGWGTYYNHSLFSNNYNWTSFKNDMDGADVELKIRRLGTKVAVKATYTTTSGLKYYQQYVYTSSLNTENMRVFLTVDNSHITNLASSTADTPNSANEYLYTIKAVDGSDNDLSTFATGAYWTDESAITLAIPQYILSGTSLLGVAKQNDDYWYRVSVTPNSANYVHKVTYNNESISNVVYFSEAEDISGFSESTSSSITSRASGGKCARSSGSFKDLTTLGAGKYKVYVRGNADGTSRKVSVKAGDATVLDNWEIGNGTDQKTNAEFSITSNTTITVACTATSTTGLDWIYIQKIGDFATIGSTGWTTYASPYALDLSGMTASTGSVTAYYASAVGADKVTMTSTESTGVAAGEGLMLKGTAGATITIPVVGSGSAIAGNKLVGCTSSTPLSANANYYVLVNNGGTAEFQSLATNGATIPAGKAYLNASAGARLSIVFEDEGVTAIKAIDAFDNSDIKADGKYLERGKIVIVKNGVKFNTNGQKIK